jgi:hypothetical protein
MSSQLNRLDKPPAPRSIDLAIHRHQGSTVALDLMPKTLQTSKAQPTPSLKKMIEILSKENGRLREELACHQKLQEAGEELGRELAYNCHRLKMALGTFRMTEKDIKVEFGRLETTETSPQNVKPENADVS